MHFPSGARVMTISAISSFSASQTSSYQTYRQAFSQLTNALQSGNLSAAQRRLQHAGIVTRSSGQWAFCTGAAANRPGSAIGRSERCTTGAGLVATAATGAWPSPPPMAAAHLGTSDASQTQNSANASDPDNNDDTDNISIDIQVTETSIQAARSTSRLDRERSAGASR